jgi:hypothetical protein
LLVIDELWRNMTHYSNCYICWWLTQYDALFKLLHLLVTDAIWRIMTHYLVLYIWFSTSKFYLSVIFFKLYFIYAPEMTICTKTFWPKWNFIKLIPDPQKSSWLRSQDSPCPAQDPSQRGAHPALLQDVPGRQGGLGRELQRADRK